jgi:hypothetical protein
MKNQLSQPEADFLFLPIPKIVVNLYSRNCRLCKFAFLF